METTSTKKIIATAAAAAFSLGLHTSVRAADPCGQPPAPTSYSRDFYKAQAKYYASNSQTSAGLSIPVGDLPIGANFASSDATEGWESLTLAEAEQIIQDEHRDKEAAIIQECGYRMCQLMRTGVSNVMAITMLGEVCQGVTGGMRPGIENPYDAGSHSADPIMGGENNPSSRTVIFDSDAVVRTVHYVKNDTPATMRLRWHLDNNQMMDGSPLLSVEKMPRDPQRPTKPRRLGSTIRIKPHQTFEYVVAARRPDRDQQRPSIVFAWVGNEDYRGELKYMVLREEPVVDCRDVTVSYTKYFSAYKNNYFTGVPMGDGGSEIKVPMHVDGPVTGGSCWIYGESAGWTHEVNRYVDPNDEKTYIWRGWSNSGAPGWIDCNVTYTITHQECE